MIKTVIFDLGGIFVQIDTKQSIQELCEKLNSLPEREVLNVLIHSDHYHQYEKGLVDSHTFYQNVKEELGGNFSFLFFKKIWQHIFSPVQPMIDLLPQFKLKYQLVLLSNTNALHMQYIEKEYPFFHYFNHIVYSYEIGMIKPEKQIFQYTLNKIGCDANECVFIDDTDENIRSAEECGIRSYRFIHPKYLQRGCSETERFSIENVSPTLFSIP